MAIQRLKYKDLDTAMEVIKAFFTREFNQDSMTKFLSSDKNYMLVYRIEDKVAGFAYGYELQRFDGRKNMMYMHQVEVLPEFRKGGIGRKLMEGFIEICKNNDCQRLFLITNKSNTAAVTLYERSGGKAPSDDDIVFTFEV